MYYSYFVSADNILIGEMYFVFIIKWK